MNNSLSQMNTPLLTGQNVELKRAELKRYFLNAWQSYESLFNLINEDEAYYLRPEPLRHPLIFYFGHTATFYINKLILGKYIRQRINPRIEAICAVGVDEMSWDDLDSNHYDWPSVDEVRNYRDQVCQLVCQLIDTMELTLPIQQNSLAWVLLMGTEHERIHLETSSVIMRMLPLSYLTADSHWQSCKQRGDAPLNRLLDVEGQSVSLGKSSEDKTYGWDNEYGQSHLDVPAFKASEFLVSNKEFLGFVDAGGYQRPELWTEEGQQWLAYRKPSMPRFWSRKEGQYLQRNLTDEIPLPLDWPAEVNYLEAKAFCQWKSEETGKYIRLPSEPEWYCLRNLIPNEYTALSANINLSHASSSCPVNRFQQQDFYDIVGNVWQWTESEIDAFEGFKVHPLYDDFSTPTFDGKHNLIKGGSWISTGNEAIKSARYAFRRHFFQHAGFRYVESESEDIPKIHVNVFETNTDIAQQLAAHYGSSIYIAENYQKQLARCVSEITSELSTSMGRLLDLGCSVGRCAFELAPYFDRIDAVDFSARSIQHGVKLQQDGVARYAIEDEGDIVDYQEVNLDALDLQATDNIAFSQGDAANLKAVFNQYDVIIAQHIIESHYNPALFLEQVHTRLNAQGLLFVVSDYHFDENLIEKSKWFGGVKVNGENVTGREGLANKLEKHFEFMSEQDLVQEIKINSRNSQLSKKQLTVWRLK